MGTRRKTRNDADSAAPAQPDHSILRRRYADLSRKYAAVVERLQRNAAHDLAVFRLGLWGLNVTASGLALVNGNQITTRNARWLELDEVGDGGWLSEDHQQAAPYVDLNHLARTESAHLPERAPVSAARRFRRARSEQVPAGRLEPGPVQLAEVVRHAADVLQLRQRHDGPRVEVHAAIDGVPALLGTVSEVSYLFITLLFNARDAMPGGGRIEVRAERCRTRVRVIVSDEGTGIARDHLPRLFQPFFTTKGSEGTGLGLWLAQSTMRRLGGTIVARN